MKTLFAIALLASAFTFVGCGAKPADTTNAAASATIPATTTTSIAAPASNNADIAEKIADCTCETVTMALKFKKEIDAAPEDKKEAIETQAVDEMSKIPCLESIGKVPQADQDKVEAEVQVIMEKKCGAALKEIEN